MQRHTARGGPQPRPGQKKKTRARGQGAAGVPGARTACHHLHAPHAPFLVCSVWPSWTGVAVAGRTTGTGSGQRAGPRVEEKGSGAPGTRRGSERQRGQRPHPLTLLSPHPHAPLSPPRKRDHNHGDLPVHLRHHPRRAHCACGPSPGHRRPRRLGCCSCPGKRERQGEERERQGPGVCVVESRSIGRVGHAPARRPGFGLGRICTKLEAR